MVIVRTRVSFFTTRLLFDLWFDSILISMQKEMDDSSGSEILSQEDKEILRNFKAQNPKSYPNSGQVRDHQFNFGLNESQTRSGTMSGFGNDAQAEVNSYKEW